MGVQKLRKSAGLKVSDKVTMFYTVEPADHSLSGIITKHMDYIQTSSKTPLRPLETHPSKTLKTEKYDLTGAKLQLIVTPGFPPGYSSGSPGLANGPSPSCPWVNISLVNCPPAKYVKSTKAGLLLPAGPPTTTSLLDRVRDIFGLYGANLELFLSPDLSQRLDSTDNLDGATVYVARKGEESTATAELEEGFNCKFVNLASLENGETTSLLLENPVGNVLDNLREAFACLNRKMSPVFSDKDKKTTVKLAEFSNFAGQTLYM